MVAVLIVLAVLSYPYTFVVVAILQPLVMLVAALQTNYETDEPGPEQFRYASINRLFVPAAMCSIVASMAVKYIAANPPINFSQLYTYIPFFFPERSNASLEAAEKILANGESAGSIIVVTMMAMLIPAAVSCCPRYDLWWILNWRGGGDPYYNEGNAKRLVFGTILISATFYATYRFHQNNIIYPVLGDNSRSNIWRALTHDVTILYGQQAFLVGAYFSISFIIFSVIMRILAGYRIKTKA